VVILVHDCVELIGTTAKLLERNDKKEEALIQGDQTYDIETVSYDQISEFVE
jgi:hypothetical protein